MRVDVVFDTVCPWCYIGKRRLERAIAMRPAIALEIRWRPFLLNPDMPPEGMDRKTYLERKFGSSYRIERIHTAAALAAKSENLVFNFDAIKRAPSSLLSHRLIQWAEASGQQEPLVEAVFRAYFCRGEDIGEIAVLRRLAESCDLSGEAAEAHLRSPHYAGSIESENARMHRAGVSGVPCYIFDDSYAMAGAQEPDMLVRLMDIAREAEWDKVTTS